MDKVKKPLLFVVRLLPIAVIAGVFVGFYQLDTLSEDVIAAFMAEVGSTWLLVVIGTLQTVGYALFCGFFGYILADKLGLWKPLRFQKKNFLLTLIISVVGGSVFSLDHWVFGSMIDGIQEANMVGMTLSGVIASVLYGGIIEEVMMRLFFMSLIAFILWKVFCRKVSRTQISNLVFGTANIIAALLFAAGHLPAILAIFEELTPLLLFRCFLLNGGFSLVFGWLYRKHGIQYAMMGHALFHVISKLIWFIFV